ncbi:hypothetical protein G7Z17_g1555 [Cylindrodendrum hubeiense]|uniref:Aldehyde dehydrogenase domain-containing protein n=1 Tax=Cylindrodendrum hubeiense TaxID=595255 RepID=A0A9P5HEM7_9HYPO|nr:hypothetical protein G7Z17_g1555 [Cylindrodendrum hubeiense]
MSTLREPWHFETIEEVKEHLSGDHFTPFKLANFVDGDFKTHLGDDWIDTENPQTGKLLARIPSSTEEDVENAVRAAEQAFPAWSRTPRSERSRYLLQIAKLIEQRKEQFAIWESIDQGKTLARARIEIERAVSNFSYFATYSVHEKSAARWTDDDVLTYEHRSPVGPFALISPWNMPLYLLTWKIAPCLAFGCTAVAKPSEICLCGSRIYIQRTIYKEFIAKFVSHVAKTYQLGKTVGAVASRGHFNKVRGFLTEAMKYPDSYLLGSIPEENPTKGYWIEPTILEVPIDSSIMREEIFGPVVTVAPFDTEEEALRLANDSQYGLASVLLTNDARRIRYLGERLEAGMVWVNCWLVRELGTPFGGMKASGTGREGGDYSRDVFTNVRTVHIPQLTAIDIGQEDGGVNDVVNSTFALCSALENKVDVT